MITTEPTRRVSIPSDSGIRCVRYIAQRTGGPPSGQQISSDLPAGTYDVYPDEYIQVSFLGLTREHVATRLERDLEVFYVPSQAIATL